MVLEPLLNNVEVYTDEYGVPHVFAENEKDLFFVAGYVAARDRLFQLSMVDLAVRGSLSSVLDPITRYELLPAFPVSYPSIYCSPLLPNSSLPFPAVPPKSSIFNNPASKVKLASPTKLVPLPPVITLLSALLLNDAEPVAP